MLKPEWIPLAYQDTAAQQPPIAAAASTKPKPSRVKTLQINKKKYPASRPSK
ncbi:hypothetical protein [Mucilaginibacter sp.]|uniref:hypothetical protein n=1 Tax=Mucilaginibacter sp. TaxID=1882438 RepID=UPI00283C0D74|nr:hypothetical protein [Mucilaginibacter sp.]MDR3696549.1 hypothetical protein [Mucilaginibacter sp.]